MEEELQALADWLCRRICSANVPAASTWAKGANAANGEFSISDSELRPPSCLDEWALPVKVLRSSIGRLCCRLREAAPTPSSHRGPSLSITVSDLHVILGPKRVGSWDSDLDEAAEASLRQRRKQLRAYSRELLCPPVEANGAAAGLVSALRSRVERWALAQFLMCVHVDVRNTHIRYEDTVSNPSFVFSAGLVLRHLKMADMASARSEGNKSKRVSARISAYWQSHESTTLATDSDWKAAMASRVLQQPEPAGQQQRWPSQEVLQPTDIDLELSTPCIRTGAPLGLDISVQDFMPCVSQAMLSDLALMGDLVARWRSCLAQRGELDRRFQGKGALGKSATDEPTSAGSRGRWRRVLKRIKQLRCEQSPQQHCWEIDLHQLLRWHRWYLDLARQEMDEIDKARVEGREPDLDLDVEVALEMLESMLPLRLLRLWRRQAAGHHTIPVADLALLGLGRRPTNGAQELARRDSSAASRADWSGSVAALEQSHAGEAPAEVAGQQPPLASAASAGAMASSASSSRTSSRAALPQGGSGSPQLPPPGLVGPAAGEGRGAKRGPAAAAAHQDAGHFALSVLVRKLGVDFVEIATPHPMRRVPFDIVSHNPSANGFQSSDMPTDHGIAIRASSLDEQCAQLAWAPQVASMQATSAGGAGASDAAASRRSGGRSMATLGARVFQSTGLPPAATGTAASGGAGGEGQAIAASGSSGSAATIPGQGGKRLSLSITHIVTHAEVRSNDQLFVDCSAQRIWIGKQDEEPKRVVPDDRYSAPLLLCTSSLDCSSAFHCLCRLNAGISNHFMRFSLGDVMVAVVPETIDDLVFFSWDFLPWRSGIQVFRCQSEVQGFSFTKPPGVARPWLSRCCESLHRTELAVSLSQFNLSARANVPYSGARGTAALRLVHAELEAVPDKSGCPDSHHQCYGRIAEAHFGIPASKIAEASPFSVAQSEEAVFKECAIITFAGSASGQLFHASDHVSRIEVSVPRWDLVLAEGRILARMHRLFDDLVARCPGSRPRCILASRMKLWCPAPATERRRTARRGSMKKDDAESSSSDELEHIDRHGRWSCDVWAELLADGSLAFYGHPMHRRPIFCVRPESVCGAAVAAAGVGQARSPDQGLQVRVLIPGGSVPSLAGPAPAAFAAAAGLSQQRLLAPSAWLYLRIQGAAAASRWVTVWQILAQSLQQLPPAPAGSASAASLGSLPDARASSTRRRAAALELRCTVQQAQVSVTSPFEAPLRFKARLLALSCNYREAVLKASVDDLSVESLQHEPLDMRRTLFAADCSRPPSGDAAEMHNCSGNTGTATKQELAPSFVLHLVAAGESRLHLPPMRLCLDPLRLSRWASGVSELASFLAHVEALVPGSHHVARCFLPPCPWLAEAAPSCAGANTVRSSFTSHIPSLEITCTQSFTSAHVATVELDQILVHIAGTKDPCGGTSVKECRFAVGACRVRSGSGLPLFDAPSSDDRGAGTPAPTSAGSSGSMPAAAASAGGGAATGVGSSAGAPEAGTQALFLALARDHTPPEEDPGAGVGAGPAAAAAAGIPASSSVAEHGSWRVAAKARRSQLCYHHAECLRLWEFTADCWEACNGRGSDAVVQPLVQLIWFFCNAAVSPLRHDGESLSHSDAADGEGPGFAVCLPLVRIPAGSGAGGLCIEVDLGTLRMSVGTAVGEAEGAATGADAPEVARPAAPLALRWEGFMRAGLLPLQGHGANAGLGSAVGPSSICEGCSIVCTLEREGNVPPQRRWARVRARLDAPEELSVHVSFACLQVLMSNASQRGVVPRAPRLTEMHAQAQSRAWPLPSAPSPASHCARLPWSGLGGLLLQVANSSSDMAFAGRLAGVRVSFHDHKDYVWLTLRCLDLRFDTPPTDGSLTACDFFSIGSLGIRGHSCKLKELQDILVFRRGPQAGCDVRCRFCRVPLSGGSPRTAMAATTVGTDAGDATCDGSQPPEQRQEQHAAESKSLVASLEQIRIEVADPSVRLCPLLLAYAAHQVSAATEAGAAATRSAVVGLVGASSRGLGQQQQQVRGASAPSTFSFTVSPPSQQPQPPQHEELQADFEPTPGCPPKSLHSDLDAGTAMLRTQMALLTRHAQVLAASFSNGAAATNPLSAPRAPSRPQQQQQLPQQGQPLFPPGQPGLHGREEGPASPRSASFGQLPLSSGEAAWLSGGPASPTPSRLHGKASSPSRHVEVSISCDTLSLELPCELSGSSIALSMRVACKLEAEDDLCWPYFEQDTASQQQLGGLSKCFVALDLESCHLVCRTPFDMRPVIPPVDFSFSSAMSRAVIGSDCFASMDHVQLKSGEVALYLRLSDALVALEWAQLLCSSPGHCSSTCHAYNDATWCEAGLRFFGALCSFGKARSIKVAMGGIVCTVEDESVLAYKARVKAIKAHTLTSIDGDMLLKDELRHWAQSGVEVDAWNPWAQVWEPILEPLSVSAVLVSSSAQRCLSVKCSRALACAKLQQLADCSRRVQAVTCRWAAARAQLSAQCGVLWRPRAGSIPGPGGAISFLELRWPPADPEKVGGKREASSPKAAAAASAATPARGVAGGPHVHAGSAAAAVASEALPLRVRNDTGCLLALSDAVAAGLTVPAALPWPASAAGAQTAKRASPGAATTPASAGAVLAAAAARGTPAAVAAAALRQGPPVLAMLLPGDEEVIGHVGTVSSAGVFLQAGDLMEEPVMVQMQCSTPIVRAFPSPWPRVNLWQEVFDTGGHIVCRFRSPVIVTNKTSVDLELDLGNGPTQCIAAGATTGVGLDRLLVLQELKLRCSSPAAATAPAAGTAGVNSAPEARHGDPEWSSSIPLVGQSVGGEERPAAHAMFVVSCGAAEVVVEILKTSDKPGLHTLGEERTTVNILPRFSIWNTLPIPFQIKVFHGPWLETWTTASNLALIVNPGETVDVMNVRLGTLVGTGKLWMSMSLATSEDWSPLRCVSFRGRQDTPTVITWDLTSNGDTASVFQVEVRHVQSMHGQTMGPRVLMALCISHIVVSHCPFPIRLMAPTDAGGQLAPLAPIPVPGSSSSSAPTDSAWFMHSRQCVIYGTDDGRGHHGFALHVEEVLEAGHLDACIGKLAVVIAKMDGNALPIPGFRASCLVVLPRLRIVNLLPCALEVKHGTSDVSQRAAFPEHTLPRGATQRTGAGVDRAVSAAAAAVGSGAFSAAHSEIQVVPPNSTTPLGLRADHAEDSLVFRLSNKPPSPSPSAWRAFNAGISKAEQQARQLQQQQQCPWSGAISISGGGESSCSLTLAGFQSEPIAIVRAQVLRRSMGQAVLVVSQADHADFHVENHTPLLLRVRQFGVEGSVLAVPPLSALPLSWPEPAAASGTLALFQVQCEKWKRGDWLTFDPYNQRPCTKSHGGVGLHAHVRKNGVTRIVTVVSHRHMQQNSYSCASGGFDDQATGAFPAAGGGRAPPSAGASNCFLRFSCPEFVVSLVGSQAEAFRCTLGDISCGIDFLGKSGKGVLSMGSARFDHLARGASLPVLLRCSAPGPGEPCISLGAAWALEAQQWAAAATGPSSCLVSGWGLLGGRRPSLVVFDPIEVFVCPVAIAGHLRSVVDSAYPFWQAIGGRAATEPRAAFRAPLSCMQVQMPVETATPVVLSRLHVATLRIAPVLVQLSVCSLGWEGKLGEFSVSEDWRRVLGGRSSDKDIFRASLTLQEFCSPFPLTSFGSLWKAAATHYSEVSKLSLLQAVTSKHRAPTGVTDQLLHGLHNIVSVPFGTASGQPWLVAEEAAVKAGSPGGGCLPRDVRRGVQTSCFSQFCGRNISLAHIDDDMPACSADSVSSSSSRNRSHRRTVEQQQQQHSRLSERSSYSYRGRPDGVSGQLLAPPWSDLNHGFGAGRFGEPRANVMPPGCWSELPRTTAEVGLAGHGIPALGARQPAAAIAQHNSLSAVASWVAQEPPTCTPDGGTLFQRIVAPLVSAFSTSMAEDATPLSQQSGAADDDASEQGVGGLPLPRLLHGQHRLVARLSVQDVDLQVILAELSSDAGVSMCYEDYALAAEAGYVNIITAEELLFATSNPARIRCRWPLDGIVPSSVHAVRGARVSFTAELLRAGAEGELHFGPTEVRCRSEAVAKRFADNLARVVTEAQFRRAPEPHMVSRADTLVSL